MPFFTEDIVERIDGTGFGVIARSWHEQGDYDANTSLSEDPLMRPLLKGEVGIQTYPSGKREILSESLFRLVDRGSFVRGDFCKRDTDDTQSGVVLNVKAQVRVQHAITGDTINQWFDKDEFRPNQPLLPGDFVFYDNWVGQVEEVFNEALMVCDGNKMQPVYELGPRFSVGEKCFPVSESNPSTPKGEPTDVIVKIVPIAAAISWSAVNQLLDSSDIQDSKRPLQFWSVNDLPKLSAMRSRGAVSGSVGERVVFKDPRRAAELGVKPVIYKDQDMRIDFCVDVMVIISSRTRVQVLWQDGSREWLPSVNLVPHLNPDEYDCWPGDYVLWKNDEGQKVSIVQQVSAKERVATIRCVDDGGTEEASVLELDPHGMSFNGGNNGLDAFGLRRGEYVLLHRPEADNGVVPPQVPRIGELESWVNEMPTRSPSGNVEGWRGQLTNMAMQSLGYETSRKDPLPKEIDIDDTWITLGHVIDVSSGGQPGRFDAPKLTPPDNIDWFGQVTDLTLDGNVVVSLPSCKKVTVPVNRCSLYRDVDDYQWDADPNGDAFDDEQPMSETSWEALDAAEERNDWSHMEMEESVESPMWSKKESREDQYQTSSKPQFARRATMPGSYDSSPPSPPSDYEEGTPHAPGPIMDVQPSTSLPSQTASSDEDVRRMLTESETSPEIPRVDQVETEECWKRFDVLPAAPIDHAFYSVDPSQPSKSFLSRLAKEYRVLETSLPDSIIVRAYEDRTDLLRSLIIGPQNTPYEDAPFVIDWRLDSNFPQSPPIAHFLSWTNGNGRVNPNLYEEGKVCLSILGTWAGEKSESWNAARSSLLQAFVSIQGLVLVRDPYFCEPSFEKMRGTEEGQLNSRLYSEKAYVLSRGFVRRALEIPLGGLEKEITYFYYTRGGLKRVLAHAEDLIKRSAGPVAQDSDLGLDIAIPRLSVGGALTLNRTLTKLRGLLDAMEASS